MNFFIHAAENFLQTNYFFAVIIAYLGGVVTTFTPCIFPMIPVTIAITLGAGAERQTILKPFAYCLGIAVVYALLGMFASATGTFFGQWASNPLFYLLLAVVFIILGLNSLDLIRLPAVASRFRANNKSFFSLFLFGALTGVVFSPCTAPLMGLFLVYAATKNLFAGGLLLFSYALGFSSILLAIAWVTLHAKDRVPKAGRWMNGVKYFIVSLSFIVASYLVYKAIGLF